MQILYTAEVTAYGGRTGRVTSSDDHLDVELAAPPELGGPDGETTNPEQLLAAGYAGCFMSAMTRVASAMNLDASGATVTARVALGAIAENRFGLDIEMHAELPALEQPEADKLMAATHQVCPISNALRGEVVRLTAN